MRSSNVLAPFLALALSVPVGAQTVTAAKAKAFAGWYVVTFSNGEVLDVPDDPKCRHRQLLAEWVAQGNQIAEADPVPDAEKRATALERALDLEGRILKLAALKSRLTAAGMNAKATACQNKIDNINAALNAILADL